MVFTFFRKRKGKNKKKKKKKPTSMWDMMQKMSVDFKEQEKRVQEKREYIERKRKILAAKGIEIDEIDVEKPRSNDNDRIAGSESMWDMMQRMDRKFQEEMEYLDRVEKALDDAISKIDSGEFTAPIDEDKMYAKKKRIVKD